MNLTADNYFSTEAQREYMSTSTFKAFEKCEAAALAELNGEFQHESSSAMMIGSYVDAYFSGEMEQFKTEHPEIFRKDGGLKADYVQADRIIERVKQDEMFMSFLSGKPQVILTGYIEGVKCKIKVDSLHDDKIVDLKVMKDMAPIYDETVCARVPFFEFYGYTTQAAIYSEIVRQATGKTLPFYLAVVTKQTEPDMAIIHMAQSDIDLAMENVNAKIVRYDAIRQGIIEPTGCGECAYCRRHKKLTEIIESDSPLFV